MKKDHILKLCGPPDEKPDAAKRGVVTQAGRKRIRAKTGGTCHVCGGRAGKRWHADHVKPRRLGGTSEDSNYLPTCQECNRLRWGYPPEVLRFIMRLGVYAKKEIREETPLGKALIGLVQRRDRANRRRKV